MGSYGKSNAASDIFVFFHEKLKPLDSKGPIPSVILWLIFTVGNDSIHCLADDLHVPGACVLTATPSGSYNPHSEEAEPKSYLGTIIGLWFSYHMEKAELEPGPLSLSKIMRENP